MKGQDCTGIHSDVVHADKYVDSKFHVYCSCRNMLILWMLLTICWYPSVSYYFSWIYPLLLQGRSHCSSTLFLHRFSASLCVDQMAKFFDKALNYIGPALCVGWTSWLLEVLSNLNYCVILGSSVLYHLCSDHHGDDAVSLGGCLEVGLGQSKAIMLLWEWETGHLNQWGWQGRTAWRRVG